ncbi:hypothetical protein [Shimia sp.]|uniref:hypothetical protein n=1 Tax=Shimia sp. TaxID=1954381 RepID=UPI0035649102
MSGYVITLSSIPPRFDRMRLTLDKLVRQTVPAARVIVYLPRSYTRFPEWDGRLPEVPEGVEIRIADRDWGPATKLLPALREFPQDQEILFCDDDMDYPEDWAEGFLAERRRRPEACITLCSESVLEPARRKRRQVQRPRAFCLWNELDLEQHLRLLVEGFGRRVLGWPRRFVGRRRCLVAGYAEIFMGYGGVLVRPEFFDEDVFDIPPELRRVDDYWLSGVAAKNGHHAWMIPRRREPTSHPHYAEASLTDLENSEGGRSAANAHAVRYLQGRYGIWL